MKLSSPTVIARGDAVYFIATVCKTYIKIGRSNDTMRRLATLQTSSPLKLVLLGAVHARPAYEKYLHACFAKQRTHGEWFRFDQKLQHAAAVILGQPSLNFPDFEYAPEINGASFEDFFKTIFATPKNLPTNEPLDPLEEYYRSPEFARCEAERDAMTSEQLRLLAKLEEAQVEIMKRVDARGNEQVLAAGEAGRLAFQVLGLTDETPTHAIVDCAVDIYQCAAGNADDIAGIRGRMNV